MYRLFKRIVFACRGLGQVVRREKNFQLELAACLLVAAVGWWWRFSRLDWALVVVVTALVLLIEIHNTVLERVLDLLEPRLSRQVSQIKDMQAAAVLVAALAAAVVGILLVVSRW